VHSHLTVTLSQPSGNTALRVTDSMANPVLVPAAGAQAEGVQQPAAAVSAVHNSSLYVGDLDREVTEQQLCELFSQVLFSLSLNQSLHLSLLPASSVQTLR
jgi:RNA recognition motif-containing protein